MKVQATDGRSSFLEEATELTPSTTAFAGGWGMITALGASSYFDTLKDSDITGGVALKVGCPVLLPAWTNGNCPLLEGDKVLSFEQKVTCWTTDCPQGMSEGEVDQTTQCDIIEGRKDIVGDGNITETGTINGLFNSLSEQQRELEGLFADRIIEKGGKITLIPRQKNKVFWHLFCYREMKDSGEVEVYRIRKMRISGVTEGQAQSGNTPFNFNYTTLARWNYEKTVAAA